MDKILKEKNRRNERVLTTYRLSQKQKRTWRPRLIAHYGHVCYYCKGQFLEVIHTMQGMANPLSEEWDHLNNREYDNRVENLVLAHKVCNSKKKYNERMREDAMTQLRDNEIHGISEFNQVEVSQDPKELEDEKNREYNEEIYANTEFAKITQEYVAEKLKTVERIPYKTTIDSITYLAFEKVGHGSQNSIRRIMDMLCSEEGIYYKYRDGGKQWISKTNPMFGK